MSVTSDDISRVLKAVPTELLIGGSWVAGEDTLDVEDPSTGEVLTSIADASPEQGIAALDAAVAAADSWEQTDPRERGEILRRAFTLITERADDIALLMTLEMGKPLERISRRDQLRRRVLPMVLRGSGAGRRPLCGRSVRRHPAAHNEAARGTGLCDHTLELSVGHGHAEARPGGGGRLHGRDQAGRANPADHAGAGWHSRRGGIYQTAC